jgi:hypothetical protein
MRSFTRSMSFTTGPASLVALVLCSGGCSGGQPETITGLSTFHIEITSVNGKGPPPEDAPLPPNHGDRTESWGFSIQARSPFGAVESDFNGVVRLTLLPGTIVDIQGTGAIGRNIQLHDGFASGTIDLTAVYGPARLWVEDLGYVPAPAGTVPACSNGKNDGYPSNPGCYAADDSTTTGGTYAAGVSGPVWYALPAITDARGQASRTPYAYDALEINTAPPQNVVITRVSNNGLFVTDLAPAAVASGYNSLFAFNFSTPDGVGVCDHVTYLAGTINDFYGFTELNFPSFRVDSFNPATTVCPVPEPTVVGEYPAATPLKTISDPVAMDRLESSLVRVTGFHTGKKLGPQIAKAPLGGVKLDVDQTNCDYNGDGAISGTDENNCRTLCDADPECSEWTNYTSRGEYALTDGSTEIQMNTGTVSAFEPTANRNVVIADITGTLRKFSGGTRNWTIETRCPDDLVCATGQGCVAAVLPSTKACVRPATQTDNDQGSN